MSRSLSKRIATIDVLIKGSTVAGAAKTLNDLDEERKQLERATSLSSPRRELVQVLHTSRLLDSFLAEFVRCHAIPFGPSPAMGAYLRGLRDHTRHTISRLPEHRRQLHQRRVVDVRNVYMHRAGSFPTKRQADELLSSMHVCLADIAALE